MLLPKLTVAALAISLLAFCGRVAGDDAVKKDRQLYAGTWQVVSAEANGNKVSEEDAKKIVVINKEDGAWTLQVEGKVVARGTSKIDPAKKPKTIDLTETEGEDKGKTFLGIYEVGKDSRKVCLAESDKERPTQFSTKPGSGHVLAVFKRVKK
jgi:uncharacterized protein (TIGR03067 family)